MSSMFDLDFVVECGMLMEYVDEFSMAFLDDMRPEPYFDSLNIQALSRLIYSMQRDNHQQRDAELMILLKARYYLVRNWMGEQYAKERHEPLDGTEINFSNSPRVIH